VTPAEIIDHRRVQVLGGPGDQRNRGLSDLRDTGSGSGHHHADSCGATPSFAAHVSFSVALLTPRTSPLTVGTDLRKRWSAWR
jgi:hypothetical protein